MSTSNVESSLLFVLLSLLVIVPVGRLVGSFANYLRQPRAVGEIVGGLVVGALLSWWAPGWLASDGGRASALILSVMAQIGVVLMMFQLGMEFEFAHLRDACLRRALILLTVLGITIPFGVGFVFAQYYAAHSATADAWGFSLFAGVAFSITALPILGRILVERRMQHSQIGVLAFTAAGVNDLIGWVMLGAVTLLALGDGDTQGFITRMLTLVVFVAFCCTVLRRVAGGVVQAAMRRYGGFGDDFLALFLAAVLALAVVTSSLGVFAVFGGFLAGIILYGQRDFAQVWSARIAPFVNIVLVPIFFTYTGMRTQLGALATATDWLWCAAWVAAACLSKFGASMLAARFAGMSGHDAFRIGVLLNTRALMELVVLNIGMDLGLIPQKVFTMLVIMAIVSTLITAPLLQTLERRHRVTDEAPTPAVL